MAFPFPVESQIVPNGSTSVLVTNWVEKLAAEQGLKPEYIRLQMRPPNPEASDSMFQWPHPLLDIQCGEDKYTATVDMSLISDRPVWVCTLVALQAERKRAQGNVAEFSKELSRIKAQVTSDEQPDHQIMRPVKSHIAEALSFYCRYLRTLLDIGVKEWHKIYSYWLKEINGYMGLRGIISLAEACILHGHILLSKPIPESSAKSAAPVADKGKVAPRYDNDCDNIHKTATSKKTTSQSTSSLCSIPTEDTKETEGYEAEAPLDSIRFSLNPTAIEKLRVSVSVANAIVVHAKALNFGKISEMDLLLRQMRHAIRVCDLALQECVAVFGPSSVQLHSHTGIQPIPEEPSELEKSLVEVYLKRDAESRDSLRVALGEGYVRLASKSLLDIAEDICSLLLDTRSYACTQPRFQEEKDDREEERGLESEQGDDEPAIETTLPTADDLSVIKSTFLSLNKANAERVRTGFAVLRSTQTTANEANWRASPKPPTTPEETPTTI